MKRIIAIGLIFMILVSLSSCNEKSQTSNTGSFYKTFNKMKGYDTNVPENYKYTDFKVISNLFDEIVFNFDANGDFLPLIWEDKTNNSFGVPAYVGDGRMEKDGAQEGVTAIAAVLYASINGIDKSNQDGKDYVSGLNAFFSTDEGIVLNNPDGSSKTTSMWYLIYPAILYTQVSMLYENQEIMRKNTITNIESWFKAYQIMCKDTPDFDYTGFDFTTMTPYRNGIWKEPDSAVGMAILFRYGYLLTGNEEYLDATINLMDYIEDFFGGPLYEVLMYYAPALVADLNALHGTNYDITKSLNRVFDGASIPRGGWGSIAGKWGDMEVNGFFGSTTDGGGYAFSMNTFAAAGAIAPLVRYDSRYAKSIGKFLLHLHSNSRYFFSKEVIKENQSITYIDQDVPEDIIRAIPYEGIRKQSNGRTPWVGGDPTVYDWAQTDFSLYSGAHTGILGALYEETNQEAILKIDLLATDTLGNIAYPTYLIYNPHEVAKEITYKVSDLSINDTDLFDTVTNSILASGVNGETSLTIQPDEAIVIVEIPAEADVNHLGNNYFVNDRYISSDRVTISINGAENNDTISNKVTLTVMLASNFDDKIEQSILTCDDEEITFTDKITLSSKDFGTGSKQIQIKTTTKNGFSDEAVIRLIFE